MGGILGASEPRSEAAGAKLAGEPACIANTPGGGALIVGVADNGELLGTAMDHEWMRGRIYDLSQQRLTVETIPVTVSNCRLVVIRAPEAIEPVRVKGRITWRVDNRCVEVDASSWHDRRLRRIGFDWSAQRSGHRVEEARQVALGRARDFLRDSGEDGAQELADQRDLDFLKRLNVVDGEWLTNAGALAFIGRGSSALDYQRREYAGGDSVQRVQLRDRGLVEELYEVELAVAASNPIRHVPGGLVSAQFRELPPRAVREAMVNGVVHRDWTQSQPTVVEHIGSKLVVTSPGGFVAGVGPSNILTHPSASRNPALAQLCAALRIAEREGIGVDRMYADMIRVGHAPPAIEEISGPFVRAALVGNMVDEGWMHFLGRIRPDRAAKDLNSLLVLRHLAQHLWIDAEVAAPLLQQSRLEARAVISDLATATVEGQSLVEAVDGVPAGAEPGWRLSWAATALVTERSRPAGTPAPDGRAEVALSWARARERISSTELGSIVGAASSNVGGVLKQLEADGLLARVGRLGAAPDSFMCLFGTADARRPKFGDPLLSPITVVGPPVAVLCPESPDSPAMFWDRRSADGTPAPTR